jgi:CubicO group peptidase (beta-lactamase class C family)
VRKWLPSLPRAADRIHILHLLAHTHGLTDFEELIPRAASRQLHDADVLALLEAENRTYFAPGTGFRYSNSGYVLLALVAARAAGLDFASFLRERIFDPLDMRATVAFEAGISVVADRAYGYSGAGGHDAACRHDAAGGHRAEGGADSSWRRADQSPTSATLGDGGIYSSIDDLAKWDAALYDNRLLCADSLRLAFTPATVTPDPRVQYGFGWRISGAMQWHSGESTGFRHVILRFPEIHLTVIVLTNRDDPEPYPLALAIAEESKETRSGPYPAHR